VSVETTRVSELNLSENLEWVATKSKMTPKDNQTNPLRATAPQQLDFNRLTPQTYDIMMDR
jgi:hypothetical protein